MTNLCLENIDEYKVYIFDYQLNLLYKFWETHMFQGGAFQLTWKIWHQGYNFTIFRRQADPISGNEPDSG